MKREDLKASFDRIEPDKSAQIRMLDNILSHSGKERKMTGFNFKKAVPALSLAALIAFGFLAYDMMIDRNNIATPPGYATDSEMPAREDMVAPLINQFQIDDRHYIFLSDDLRQEFGFPQQVNESDVGDKIITISKSVDPSLIGCEVYSYKPAGGDAVVAVKKDNAYQLFKFFNFESYNNNQDEDAIEYLKLYGINKAEDISKVQFILYSEQNKIEGRLDVRELTGRDEIEKFYSYFSVLKNSSDKYFEKLFSFRPVDNAGTGVESDIIKEREMIPPDAAVSEPVKPDAQGSIDPVPGKAEIASDAPLMTDDGGGTSDRYNEMPVASDGSAGMVSEGSQGMMDMGGTVSVGAATTPSQGGVGDALANPVGVRIYNQNGVYFETMYYKNIGFISRYEVNEEFARFIEESLR